jgi:hypothetical protein
MGGPGLPDQIHARETTFRWLETGKKYIGSRVVYSRSDTRRVPRRSRARKESTSSGSAVGMGGRAAAGVTDAKVVRGTVDDLPPDLRRFDVVAAGTSSNASPTRSPGPEDQHPATRKRDALFRP